MFFLLLPRPTEVLTVKFKLTQSKDQWKLNICGMAFRQHLNRRKLQSHLTYPKLSKHKTEAAKITGATLTTGRATK